MVDLSVGAPAESSADVAVRVRKARDRQAERLRPYGFDTNAEAPGRLLRGALRLAQTTTRPLEKAMVAQTLTARGFDRVLRIAWTIADLAEVDRPGDDEIGQALLLRAAETAA
ncbi:hypothetical protein [Sinomonas sp. P47F7]|uniref:magnesium chelatase subunit ChlI family protein n=1 Tax=Sinomonas sp. P47F7 TaxID=3410987 RepID=UPI003BF4C072